MFGELDKIKDVKSSYSLEGEDRIALSLLRRCIDQFDDLFYLDIGANDPIAGNNTYLFYELGQRGICVDPLTHLNREYERLRPHDSFFCGCLGESRELDLYIFDDDSATSTDQLTSNRYKEKFSLKDVQKTLQRPADEIIESYGIHEATDIPLVSIDVEGSDYDVCLHLLSESKHQYHLFIVEDKCVNINPTNISFSSGVNTLFHDFNYSLIAKTPLNSFYILNDSDYFKWIPVDMLSLVQVCK